VVGQYISLGLGEEINGQAVDNPVEMPLLEKPVASKSKKSGVQEV